MATGPTARARLIPEVANGWGTNGRPLGKPLAALRCVGGHDGCHVRLKGNKRSDLLRIQVVLFEYRVVDVPQWLGGGSPQLLHCHVADLHGQLTL